MATGQESETAFSPAIQFGTGATAEKGNGLLLNIPTGAGVGVVETAICVGVLAGRVPLGSGVSIGPLVPIAVGLISDAAVRAAAGVETDDT